MTTRFVAYYRVSTDRQGRSGLGLDGQREAVENHANRVGGTIIASFQEVESGKANDRPELHKAIHHAKVTGATLLIAKLDRLSRNAAFLLTLRDSGVPFLAADMPDANNLSIGVMAVVAQEERRMISERTKTALQRAKASGKKLGNPNGAAALRRYGKGHEHAAEARKAYAKDRARDILPIIDTIRQEGTTSLNGIAKELNQRGIKTARGGRWYAASVRNLLQQAEAAA
jgi:DNA invertase Pin-like site-specific DNA recombinase